MSPKTLRKYVPLCLDLTYFLWVDVLIGLVYTPPGNLGLPINQSVQYPQYSHSILLGDLNTNLLVNSARVLDLRQKLESVSNNYFKGANKFYRCISNPPSKEILHIEFGRDEKLPRTEQDIRNYDGKSTIWCVSPRGCI
jgi:hypothetical protein